jgi:hypothetical protein
MLEHIDGHRHLGSPEMTYNSRVVMHDQLEVALASLITEEVEATMRRRQSPVRIPSALVGRHIASTFVLVLNWWVECEPALAAVEVDARFRALVLPTQRTL